MKYIILFLFFLSCNTQKSITSAPQFINDVDCQEEINRAVDDYRKGKKKYIIQGLVVADEFQMYYTDYMLNGYNISVEANCNPNFKEQCYANAMENEIENEFGKKFLIKTLEQAKRKYRKIKRKHQTKI